MVNVPSSLAALSSPISSKRDWAVAGICLAIGLLCFAFIFSSEIDTAIHVWLTSEAYNHCLLVIPVAIYLGYQRREALAATAPRPTLWLALVAAPLAAAWFLADRLGLMEGRQIAAMALVQVMVACILGLAVWRTLAAPLLYLFFLVPFGEFFVQPLQVLVLHFTTTSLDLLGIPNFSDGVMIEIPEGAFLVHEACSGLRFLVASAAFGVLYACVIFTSALRRAVFIIVSIFVAVLANCLRVVGIILVAHLVGNSEAVKAGHVLWGWGFYVIVGAVLMLIGLAFRQDGRSLTAESTNLIRDTRKGAFVVALAVIILIATMPRLGAAYLDQLDPRKAAILSVELPPLPGCDTAALPSEPLIPPTANGSDATNAQSTGYRCGSDLFVVTIHRYPPRIGVRPLFLSLREATTPPASSWDIIQQGIFEMPQSESVTWELTQGSTREHGYVALATGLWINGQSMPSGIPARVQQALNTFRASPASPIFVVITYFGGKSQNETRLEMEAFLRQTAVLSETIRNSVGLRQ